MSRSDSLAPRALRLPAAWPALLALAATAGCHKADPPGEPISAEPAVHLARPERRDLYHEVGQPGYIYAYEQTSLFPKISGYIDKWYVDIGDPIKKGEVIADLFVPELHTRYRTKKAQVALSEEGVKQAERLVGVAESNVQVATTQVARARADVEKYAASVERWESEVQRLAGLGQQGVVDQQVLLESRKQLKADTASLNAAREAVKVAEAEVTARRADLEKAKEDVAAARAQVQVDKAEEETLATLVGYTHMPAPYDGIVVLRNANTGDYVEPRYGDESAPRPGYATETRTQGTPVYVVARTDKVRVYVDVPETEAPYVRRGTKARVRVQALNDEEIPATVTRTSWALDYRSRTLRAEIDLPNEGARLLPGMYTYALVTIERHNVLTVPEAAVVEIGNENTCYLYEDGRAVRTPVQTGIRDGKAVEVLKKKVNDQWVGFAGEEEVILADLAGLRDGQKVRVPQDMGAEQNEAEPNPANKEKR